MTPRFYNRRGRHTMLLPQAYDPAWTSRRRLLGLNAPPSRHQVTRRPAVGSTGAIGSTSAGQVMAANPRRACLIIKNTSAAGGPELWYSFGQPAQASAPGSFSLDPGEGLVIANPESCPKEAIWVTWSGAGTRLAAFYQNSLPESVPTPAGTGASWTTNLSAMAYGYSPQSATGPAG